MQSPGSLQRGDTSELGIMALEEGKLIKSSGVYSIPCTFMVMFHGLRGFSRIFRHFELWVFTSSL